MTTSTARPTASCSTTKNHHSRSPTLKKPQPRARPHSNGRTTPLEHGAAAAVPYRPGPGAARRWALYRHVWRPDGRADHGHTRRPAPRLAAVAGAARLQPRIGRAHV